MSRSVRAQMVAAALAILTISGCGASQQQATTSTVTVTSTNASSTNAAAPTATSTVDNSVKVPLYQEFEAERSVGPNGKAINASLAGTEYPDSTGMWVGCNGSAATTTYKLDQKFTKLHAVAGLQPHTPDPLTVNVTISGDDRTLQQFTLSKQNPVPVDVDLSGVNSLVVAAIAVDASLCGASGTPYGALGGAQLSEVAQ